MRDGETDGMKLKKTNLILNACFLLLTAAPVVFCVMGSWFDYEVTLRYPALYAWMTAVCGLLAAWVSSAESEGKQDSAMQIRIVMPIVSMLYVIMMLYLARWERIILPALICPVCAAYLFHLNARGGLLRMAFKVISFLVSPLFVILVLMLVLLSDFGKTTVVQKIELPDQRHLALLVDVDQGALGGNTDVFVEHKRNVIDLGFFLMQKKTLVYRTGWGAFEDMELEWKDEETILINGNAFQVE